MDPEFLTLLLGNDNAWETFMEEVQLSSEEGDVLREALRKHEALTGTEGNGNLQKKPKPRNAVFFFLLVLFLFCYYHYCTLANMSIIALTGMFWMYSYHTSAPPEYTVLREKILEVFPEVREKLGKRITQLSELADRADQVHRACTVGNMAASSAGLVSSAMSLAGLCLAPVTGGLSLELSEIAVGLGVAATGTSMTSSIVDQANMLSIEAKAKCMKTMVVSPEEAILGALRHNKKRWFSLCGNFTSLKQVWGHLLGTENPPARSILQKLFGSSAKTMIRRGRIWSGTTTGFFALMDAYSLREMSKHLKAGAKTEVAEMLRLWTGNLERLGDMIVQIHESLLKSQTLPE